ncbi:MAG: hydrogenase 4 subunit F [Acidobacteria bacterium]|nr:hydrogenase 4 subunit F [Acidobacteriota bacterium]MCL5287930.1 hydrogenase 4 subunit F [Acidobacteriota bacterium]
MVLLWPLVVPLLGSVVMLGCRDPRLAKRVALAFCAAEAAAIGILVWRVHESGALEGQYLRADGLTCFFLVNIAFIMVLALVYATGYLQHMGAGRFTSPRWFYALVNLFLFTMVGVCLSANLGVLWIMMEATTLASALLVGFYNTEGAVEAGWKYLVVCTVGIAFALFGTIVFYLAAVKAGMSHTSALDWLALFAAVSQKQFDPNLVRLAFVFVLVGYGTKIGFVPMHSWLPDAHAEAPTPVSAMLSAILLNCAMYALLRYDILVSRAIGAEFPGTLLVFFGLVSIVVAGLLILVQRDLKRMLAYSSVEHMGIIAIGMGLGGALGFLGALLHTFNHSIAKSLLFFGAGNVRHNFGTLRMDRITGMGRSAPLTAAALAVGALAIVGMPPFSLFVSEFAILSEAFSHSRYMVGGVFLLVLSIVFGGFAYHLFRMTCGEPHKGLPKPQFTRTEYAVMFIAGFLLLFFGIRIPEAFSLLLREAVAVLQ